MLDLEHPWNLVDWKHFADSVQLRVEVARRGHRSYFSADMYVIDIVECSCAAIAVHFCCCSFSVDMYRPTCLSSNIGLASRSQVVNAPMSRGTWLPTRAQKREDQPNRQRFHLLQNIEYFRLVFLLYPTLSASAPVQ